MEQHGMLLRGIARVLNAGGCALLSIYDAATSIRVKTKMSPGEKGDLQAQLAESEKRIERIRERLKAIEEEERVAREAAIKSAEKKAETEPMADAGEPAAPAAPVAGEGSPDAVAEEAKEIVAETVEPPEPERQKEPAESEVPVAGEAMPGPVTEEKAATEALEMMLKSELLELCMKKGIEADKRMTKAEIIALISRR